MFQLIRISYQDERFFDQIIQEVQIGTNER
jgi:hypothetical protein